MSDATIFFAWQFGFFIVVAFFVGIGYLANMKNKREKERQLYELFKSEKISKAEFLSAIGGEKNGN